MRTMTDAEIAAAIRRIVESLNGHVVRHNELMKVDGALVVVRVVKADAGQREPA
jgi:hypothetical protein